MTKRAAGALFSATMALLIAACSGSESPGASSSGGSAGSGTGGGGGVTTSSGGGAPGGGGAGGGACHDLANEGAVVNIMQLDNNVPAPLGGKLIDGRYDLTAVTVHTGPGGATGPTGGQWQETVSYLGPEVQMVVDRFQGQGVQRFTLTYTVMDGGAIHYSGVCTPDAGTINLPYDGYTFQDPDKLILYAKPNKLSFEYTLVEAYSAGG